MKENSYQITPYEGGESETVISGEDLNDLVDEIVNVITKDFETASRPLIKYLCEKQHPHVSAIITPTSCEMLEGKQANPKILDYLVD